MSSCCSNCADELSAIELPFTWLCLLYDMFAYVFKHGHVDSRNVAKSFLSPNHHELPLLLPNDRHIKMINTK